MSRCVGTAISSPFNNFAMVLEPRDLSVDESAVLLYQDVDFANLQLLNIQLQLPSLKGQTEPYSWNVELDCRVEGSERSPPLPIVYIP